MILAKKPLAQTQLWGWENLSKFSSENISINWFWLDNENICVSKLDDSPNLNFRNFDLPRIDWRWFLGHYTRWRKISLDFTVKGETEEIFLEKLNALKQEILKPQSTLAWKRWENFLEIDISPVSVPNVFNNYNITFLKFSVQFETLKPFWQERWYFTNTFLNRTESFTVDITNNWNENSDPVIIFAFKTGISWTDVISVTGNWKEINILETISDNDILEINSETKQVLLNWSEIDFNWSFLQLEPWGNILQFWINWTFDCDINLIHKNNFW